MVFNVRQYPHPNSKESTIMRRTNIQWVALLVLLTFAVSSCATMQQTYEDNPKAVLGTIGGAGAGAGIAALAGASPAGLSRVPSWAVWSAASLATSWTTATSRWPRRRRRGRSSRTKQGKRQSGTTRQRPLRVHHADQDLPTLQWPVLPRIQTNDYCRGEKHQRTGRPAAKRTALANPELSPLTSKGDIMHRTGMLIFLAGAVMLLTGVARAAEPAKHSIRRRPLPKPTPTTTARSTTRSFTPAWSTRSSPPIPIKMGF